VPEKNYCWWGNPKTLHGITGTGMGEGGVGQKIEGEGKLKGGAMCDPQTVNRGVQGKRVPAGTSRGGGGDDSMSMLGNTVAGRKKTRRIEPKGKTEKGWSQKGEDQQDQREKGKVFKRG